MPNSTCSMSLGAMLQIKGSPHEAGLVVDEINESSYFPIVNSIVSGVGIALPLVEWCMRIILI
jgi:hypothetical protein